MNRGRIYDAAPFLLDMKYGLLIFFISVLAASLALPQSNTPTPAKKGQTVSKKPAAKKAAPKSASAARKNASSKTTSSKKGKSGKKPAVAAARQMAPTPERYKEIQQALADKGYLKSEPNGVWDAQSADALQRFQTDQKLSATGKLSSASLIALGLGPKTAAASAIASPAPPTAIDPPPAAPTPAGEN
jgi:hypothetical protein